MDQPETRRHVHGHVLVAFLESVVLFDVVQVISPDNHGPEKLKKYILAKIQNYEKKILERGTKKLIFGSVRKETK